MKSLFLNRKKLLVIACLFLSSATLLTYAAPQIKNNGNQKADEKSKLKIISDEAKYDRKNKTAQADGHVKIIQDNVTIYTSSVLYNEEIKTSFIKNFVRIIHIDKETNRKTDITSDKMFVYHQEKLVHLEKNVRFDREEDRKIEPPKKNAKPLPKKEDREKAEDAIRRERTVITSHIADYWTKTGNAYFKGNVVVLQKEKRATGERVTVNNDANKNTDHIIIENSAKITQIKGEWLAKEGIIDPKEDKEKERLIKERIDMEADVITIYQKTSNMIGKGNVKIIQKISKKQRQATGDLAEFDDLKKTLTITGNVKIKRENEDWLTAQKAVFHTDSENFEAFSVIENKTGVPSGEKKQVESEFIIPDEDEPESEEPIGTPEPDFNLGTTPTSPPETSNSPVPSPSINGVLPVPSQTINIPAVSPSPVNPQRSSIPSRRR